MFVDEIIIEISAGSGGNGCISFRRERFHPRGGPDGGAGGDGGNVYVAGEARLRTLSHLSGRRTVKAERGGDGSGNKRTGANGDSRIIKVPLGTIISEDVTGRVIGEVLESGERVLVTKGGRGGKGNVNFATATDQAPRYATPGKPGRKLTAKLELKLLGDVALVGFPNAGKSSLLAAMAGAKPKIAEYPFTTLAPQLGVVTVDEATQFTLMEVPGLIEKASEGKGLGHDFLRHIERARRIALVVDVASTETEATIALNTLISELGKYESSLIERICLIIANKMDIATEDDLGEIRGNYDWPVAPVSAATYFGLDDLKQSLYEYLVGADGSTGI
ncbi:MAG: Obg family GTPase CgtA [bacterium]|nr:Obg family GTPase CgtA [bacterium]